MKVNLTLLFEDSFWICLYERFDYDKYWVCKITFGSEPKDYEVYKYLLKNWRKLKFSPPVKIALAEERKIKLKRMKREINEHLKNKGIGTKAQQALKLQQEENKLAQKVRNRERREEEQECQFALRQEKKRAKHKGK